MPRYFFNVYNGDELPDREGTELADDEAAQVEAVHYAADYLKDLNSKMWANGGYWRLIVTNDSKVSLFELRIVAKPAGGPSVF